MEEAKSTMKISLKGEGGKKASTRGLDIIIVGAIALIFFLSPIFFTGLVSQGIGFEKMMLFYFQHHEFHQNDRNFSFACLIDG